MNTIKTEKQIKLKTGETLRAGLPVIFQQNRPTICLVQGSRVEPYRIRVSSAFDMPPLQELEDAISDGVCMSVAGNPTEPDGWCCDGSPSWLLALGMI